jgi:hypothetical protein
MPGFVTPAVLDKPTIEFALKDDDEGYLDVLANGVVVLSFSKDSGRLVLIPGLDEHEEIAGAFALNDEGEIITV